MEVQSAIAVDLLINDEIRHREVRVIDSNGEQLGVMPVEKAKGLAETAELDLVMISPNAKPPVCKIMDYGKYRFELSKKEKESRKNQKVISIKEIRLSSTIDDHDVQVKAKNCMKFLKAGEKVKVSLRFRGRQISHSELGLKVMQDFYKLVEELCVMDRPPKMEGRSMTMILTPKK
ncbi:MAG: translation initiation factor IF-3 [Christensenellales bacterium]|jgi:translation initiation factor IF-3